MSNEIDLTDIHFCQTVPPLEEYNRMVAENIGEKPVRGKPAQKAWHLQVVQQQDLKDIPTHWLKFGVNDSSVLNQTQPNKIETLRMYCLAWVSVMKRSGHNPSTSSCTEGHN